MGWGDEIIAAGRARELQASDPRKVAILGSRGQVRWHDAWRGNPRIAKPADVAAGAVVQHLTDGPRCRPYVDTRDPARWVFNPGRVVRGELYLNDAEKGPGGDYVAVNVASKRAGKDWGLRRFQAVVKAVKAPWLQVAAPGAPVLSGVRVVRTATFRQAAGVIAGARAALLPEGGLHHAAAAFRVPAVVLFGHFIHPAITGYRDHVNVFDESGPCGLTGECKDCSAYWRRLAPEAVAENVRQLLELEECR